MKKSIFSLLALLIVSVFSCDKMPDNGDLDGQWQLMEIGTKANPADAEYTELQNTKSDRVYWAFHNALMQVVETKHTPLIFANFEYDEKHLNITSIYKNLRNADSLIADPNTTMLEPIGISGNAENFEVRQLNSKHMVLANDKKRLTFRKF